jgi:serine protease AprX
MKRCLFLLFLFVLVFVVQPNYGQNPLYWIQFNTRKGTPYSLQHPENFLSLRAIERRMIKNSPLDSTDLPVNPLFVDSLQQLGFKVKHNSRWFNGSIAYWTGSGNIDSLVLPSFVDRIELRKPQTMAKSAHNKFEQVDSLALKFYGNSYTQVSMMKGHILHEYSKGKGVHIAILDAGFQNANTHKAFDSLYIRNGVLGTFDFVEPGNNVYTEHSHGTSVLSTMAANIPGELLGTSPEASFWLFRTEDVETEYPVEEDYWVIGAEYADSLGCDLINTSLGYSEFGDPSMSHTYNDLDGKTLRISKAVNLAVDKGMVVVCSAGNEGQTPWKHIMTPSEAEKALSVAAVDGKELVAAFSSRGFGKDFYPLKPDLAAMGSGVRVANGYGTFSYSSGTSFSAPLVSGMIACLLALKPELPANEVNNLVRSYSNRFPDHDSLYGYGIPNFGLLYEDVIKTNSGVYSNSKFKAYPNPFSQTLYFETPKNGEPVFLYRYDGKFIASVSSSYYKRVTFSPQILSGLPKGIYFAVIKGKNGTESIKLIKK